MKTLIIDNYDSYTYNLFQLISEVNGDEAVVVRNDAATWEELSRRRFDNVVISPGPGTPVAVLVKVPRHLHRLHGFAAVVAGR